MASFWAAPAEVLARHERSEVQLAPPTHRTLAILADAGAVEGAFAAAERATLEPICPRLVKHTDARGETLALVLPGDPDHELGAPLVAGPSRYVLRGEHWRPEAAPRG